MTATAIPKITAFKDSPDRGRGLARDMRVRWALEEVGQPYEVQLVTFSEMKLSPYRELQPFAQIPAYSQGDLVLFESGAIVFHIAEQHGKLLPKEPNARARAIGWMFAALNTVEPPIVEKSLFSIVEREKSYYQERLPLLEDRVRVRLQDLSNQLGQNEWLGQEFSAGDLLMVHAIRRAQGAGILEKFDNLVQYIERAEARPAYQRAFEAQLKVYQDSLKQ